MGEISPTFDDFRAIAEDIHSAFPHKMVVYPGNYSDFVCCVAHARGFSKVAVVFIVGR